MRYRRFQGYDYAKGGAMFVTTALADRRSRLFGRVEREKVVLSREGEIAVRDFGEACEKFGGRIRVHRWTLMPDHFHVRFSWPAGLDEPVKTIGAFMGRFKQMSQWHLAGRGAPVWEPGYHDLVCLSARMNRAVDAYVENNALKWWLMHCDKSLMRVREPFPVPEFGDDEIWRAVGNEWLLDSPKIVALRISRQIPAARLAGVVETCRRGAVEKGYVYASTFYSPGERAVFESLTRTEGAKMIRLIPTFMELAYRPHGGETRLFAAKRLLILSRMRDPEEPPRRGELLGLNALCGRLALASDGGKAVYVKMIGGEVRYITPSPQWAGDQVGRRTGSFDPQPCTGHLTHSPLRAT